MAASHDVLAQVFGNNKIVGKILDGTTDNAMEILCLRLVSPTFNKECLRKVNRDHKKMDVFFDEKPYETDEPCTMIVNRFDTKTRHQIRWYFGFLTNIAKVQVEELRVLSRRISRDEWNLLHADIHALLSRNKSHVTVFAGVPDFCGENACADCLYYADRCREYGPLLYNSVTHLQELATAHHYDRLSISDRLLRVIANNCAELPVGEIPRHLSALISPKIACNIIHIRWARNSNGETKIPRQILEMMIQNWKVQEVELEVHTNIHRLDDMEDKWTDSTYFTAFKMDTKNNFVSPSVGFKVNQLRLNMEFSKFRVADLLKLTDQGYLFNFRRLIPTDHICVFLPNRELPLANCMLLSFKNMACQEVQRNLTLDFLLCPAFPTHEDDWYKNTHEHPAMDVCISFDRPPSFSYIPSFNRVIHDELEEFAEFEILNKWRVNSCVDGCRLSFGNRNDPFNPYNPHNYPRLYMQDGHKGITANVEEIDINLRINLHLVFSNTMWREYHKRRY